MKKIAFLGDSITEGFGVLPEQAYPAIIERMHENIACINQGRSGWATTGYIRRLDSVIRQVPTDVHVCCIQLGANDLRLHGHSDKTIDNCMKNMSAIWDALKIALPDTEIVVMSSPNMVAIEMTPLLIGVGFGKHTNEYLRRLRDSCESLARDLDIPFIDLFSTLSEGDTLDGAHPNSKAHIKIAERIWVQLQALL